MYSTARSTIYVLILVLLGGSVCIAGLPRDLGENIVPGDKYQIYWYLDRTHQNEAILVRSLEAICRQYEGRVVGVVVLRAGERLEIQDIQPSVIEVSTDFDYDPFIEGVSIYAPDEPAPLFESAAMISPEVLLQVLDREFGTDYGTLDGARNLFSLAIEELVEDCRDVLTSDKDSESSICHALESRAAVLVLPPGCSECSLKKFEDSIIEFLDNHKPAYVLVTKNTGPPLDLDWIGGDRLIKVDDPGPQLVLLTTLPVSARLHPVVCLPAATPESSPSLEVLK